MRVSAGNSKRCDGLGVPPVFGVVQVVHMLGLMIELACLNRDNLE